MRTLEKHLHTDIYIFIVHYELVHLWIYGRHNTHLNIANPARIATDQAVIASVLEVSCWRVVPACIATNDGGATPTKVPIQKGVNLTPITGDTKFMNQLGRKGVIRRNMM